MERLKNFVFLFSFCVLLKSWFYICYLVIFNLLLLLISIVLGNNVEQISKNKRVRRRLWEMRAKGIVLSLYKESRCRLYVSTKRFGIFLE